MPQIKPEPMGERYRLTRAPNKIVNKYKNKGKYVDRIYQEQTPQKPKQPPKSREVGYIWTRQYGTEAYNVHGGTNRAAGASLTNNGLTP